MPDRHFHLWHPPSLWYCLNNYPTARSFLNNSLYFCEAPSTCSMAPCTLGTQIYLPQKREHHGACHLFGFTLLPLLLLLILFCSTQKFISLYLHIAGVLFRRLPTHICIHTFPALAEAWRRSWGQKREYGTRVMSQTSGTRMQDVISPILLAAFWDFPGLRGT